MIGQIKIELKMMSKSTFLIFFECFSLLWTMWRHAQACVCWRKVRHLLTVQRLLYSFDFQMSWLWNKIVSDKFSYLHKLQVNNFSLLYHWGSLVTLELISLTPLVGSQEENPLAVKLLDNWLYMNMCNIKVKNTIKIYRGW